MGKNKDYVIVSSHGPACPRCGRATEFVNMSSAKSDCCNHFIIQDGCTAPTQDVLPGEFYRRNTSYGMKGDRLGTFSSFVARWGHNSRMVRSRGVSRPAA